MLELGVTRLQYYLNGTLDHANLTMLGTLVLIYWVKCMGGGVEKAECRYLLAIFCLWSKT